MMRRIPGLGAIFLCALVFSACAQILGFDKNYKQGDGGVPTGTSSSGTGGAGTGGSGMGGMGGMGGMAPPTPCTTVADCPGQNTECATLACTNGLCGATYAAAGTPISAQKAGNCQKIVCDGHGSLTLQVDDTNVPNDSNPCTSDVCTKGVPSNPPVKAGMTCGNNLTCDGMGHCAGCSNPGDCPGTDTDCEVRSCTGSLCGFLYTAAGTATTMQTPGDCKKNVCNGMGAVSIVFDNMDVPAATNPCATPGCSMGSVTMTSAPAGMACGTGKVCNGTGSCVQCVQASTCPGTDTECETRTCMANTCGFSYAPSGTVLTMQTPGDCKKSVCDGMGKVTSVTDNSDVPTNGNVCDTASCNNGMPVLTPVASGTPCGTNKTCNGMGSCYGCMVPTDCPGTDTDCRKRACTSGVCGFSYTASGTPTSSQTPGDCKQNVCDGMGNVTVAIDNTDTPTPTAVCTVGACSGGVPSTPYAPAGTKCTGGVCNGAGVCGVCTPGTTRFCCGQMTTLCCQVTGGPPTEIVDCNLETESCSPSPQLACCCDTSQDCESNGQWGTCY